jgi:peptide-methionine (S)-S-oxide reductase
MFNLNFLILNLFLVIACNQTVIKSKTMIPENIKKDTANTEIATLAGGCFWCLETTFGRLRGVDTVLSGYTDGKRANPSYEQVCSGATGHTEAIQIFYNKTEIDFETLLTVFFSLHDPTTLNRQGPDVGTQYRSSIFTNDPLESQIIQKVLAETQTALGKKVVTSVETKMNYYPAEEYHQKYLVKNPGQCHI